jgi:hypothetical protein
MNFKQATDALLESITLEDLADAMGLSVQTIRQARVTEGAKSHRAPPAGWEAAIRQLAAEREQHFKSLVAKV